MQIRSVAHLPLRVCVCVLARWWPVFINQIVARAKLTALSPESTRRVCVCFPRMTHRPSVARRNSIGRVYLYSVFLFVAHHCTLWDKVATGTRVCVQAHLAKTAGGYVYTFSSYFQPTHNTNINAVPPNRIKLFLSAHRRRPSGLAAAGCGGCSVAEQKRVRVLQYIWSEMNSH